LTSVRDFTKVISTHIDTLSWSTIHNSLVQQIRDPLSDDPERLRPDNQPRSTTKGEKEMTPSEIRTKLSAIIESGIKACDNAGGWDLRQRHSNTNDSRMLSPKEHDIVL
jgi:hypothetical protein